MEMPTSQTISIHFDQYCVLCKYENTITSYHVNEFSLHFVRVMPDDDGIQSRPTVFLIYLTVHNVSKAAVRLLISS
jgi:hypothetical protein